MNQIEGCSVAIPASADYRRRDARIPGGTQKIIAGSSSAPFVAVGACLKREPAGRLWLECLGRGSWPKPGAAGVVDASCPEPGPVFSAGFSPCVYGVLSALTAVFTLKVVPCTFELNRCNGWLPGVDEALASHRTSPCCKGWVRGARGHLEGFEGSRIVAQSLAAEAHDPGCLIGVCVISLEDPPGLEPCKTQVSGVVLLDGGLKAAGPLGTASCKQEAGEDKQGTSNERHGTSPFRPSGRDGDTLGSG